MWRRYFFLFTYFLRYKRSRCVNAWLQLLHALVCVWEQNARPLAIASIVDAVEKETTSN